jgi:hypothetical protein
MFRVSLLLVFGFAGFASAQYPDEPFITGDHFPILIPCPCDCPPKTPRVAHIAQRPPTDIILQWNKLALRAIKAERTPPPVAARNLAIVHVAMYDAVNAVQRTHQPFLVNITSEAGTSAEAAAAVAAHCALLSLYPKYTPTFDAELDKSLEWISEGAGKTAGVNLGHSVAEKVLALRSRDFATQSAYRARAELGRWEPTHPDYRAPLLPQWASVRPFTLRDVTGLRPSGPPALLSDEFAQSFREVKALGAINSQARTQDQTEIARFWADGEGTVTPPGHWNQIAQIMAIDRGNTLVENARLFAMLNVALADIAIVCWDCKYHFDFWRPVTAIRNAQRLNNPALEADADWTPLLPTPPFPSYTSGHSSFSAAGATVLAEFLGTDDFRFSTTSDDLPGVTRSFAKFSAAAQEAGLSRIYGGIHWDCDNRDGLAGGKKIGQYVSRSFFQPKATTTSRGVQATIAIRKRY